MSALPVTGERTVPAVPAENYWYRRHLAAYRLARRFVRGVVVDAGCGDGYGTSFLARRGPTLGLELDREVAAHAAAAYRSPWFVRADLCGMPVRHGSIDAVVAVQVLEHLHCADRFVRACRRILRPNGVLIVSTPNGGTFPPGNPSHVYEYPGEDLEALLRAHFDDVGVRGLRHAPPLALLDRVLGEPLQDRLVRDGYDDQPAWLRAVLRTVTSRDFRLTERTDDCLDLFAVATVR